MKNETRIISLLLITVLFSASVYAFAVSMPYLEGKTMILYPGATSDFEIILQNMVGEQDEMAQVTIEEGAEIAKITDKETVYKVPKGTKDTIVHIKINLPNNATLGTEWTVRFKAVSVTEKEGGMVQIAGGVSDYFKVRAGPIPAQLPKEKYSTKMLAIIGGIILLVIILLVVFYNKKRKGKEETS